MKLIKIKLDVVILTFSLAVVHPCRTPGAVSGILLQQVVRQRPAESGQVGHLGTVPGGDEGFLVRKAGLTLGHPVVPQQLTTSGENGVPWHQPGEDPLVVDRSSDVKVSVICGPSFLIAVSIMF